MNQLELDHNLQARLINVLSTARISNGGSLVCVNS